MKKNIALYMAIGLGCLGVAALFVNIEQSVIVSLSISSLFFTFGQVLASYIYYKKEELPLLVNVYNKAYNFNMDEVDLVFAKTLLECSELSTKEKLIIGLAHLCNFIAFAVLFLGFVIPFNIPNNYTAAIAIFSVALVFVNISIMDFWKERKEQWNKVNLLSLINKSKNDNNIEVKKDETCKPNA